MIWDVVIDAVLDRVGNDATIAGVIGTNLFAAGQRGEAIPSLEHLVISDVPEAEVFDAIVHQFTIWARTEAQLFTIERQLRRLLDHQIETVFGSTWLTSQWVQGRQLPGPQDEILSRAVDFRYTAIRDRYTS